MIYIYENNKEPICRHSDYMVTICSEYKSGKNKGDKFYPDSFDTYFPKKTFLEIQIDRPYSLYKMGEILNYERTIDKDIYICKKGTVIVSFIENYSRQ